MMHAAGCYHEHTRPDRDQFVIINTENISPDQRDNFDISPGQNTYSVPYDYRSVMHYGRRVSD